MIKTWTNGNILNVVTASTKALKDSSWDQSFQGEEEKSFFFFLSFNSELFAHTPLKKNVYINLFLYE